MSRKSKGPKFPGIIIEDVLRRAPSWSIDHTGVIAPGGRVFLPSNSREHALRFASFVLRDLASTQSSFTVENARRLHPKIADFWLVIFDALARSSDGEKVEAAGGYLVLAIETMGYGFTWDTVIADMTRGEASA